CINDSHVLDLRRQLAALTASAPRAAPYVGAPDVQQPVLGMLVNVGERARADDSNGVGIGDAEIAARDSNAVVTGREVLRVLREAIARQQKLQDVAAVFDVYRALAQQRRDFVDLEARVVRVADVRERVDPPARHPWDEFAVVAKMQIEAVGEVVVPGHDVGRECAALEGWRDAPGFDRANAGGIDARIRWRNARWELCAELFEQIRCRMD